MNGKNKFWVTLDASQFTCTHDELVVKEDKNNISYFDTAFSTTSSNLRKTVFETGATSHLFSDNSLLTDIVKTKLSSITVASKSGGIWSEH